MAKLAPFQVIVVDDVVRFALHVWRYLGRSLGFGIGAVPSDQTGRFRDEDEALRPLATADGSAEVWWIRATDGVLGDLEAVQRATRRGRRLYLIDVKSPEPRYREEILAWANGERRIKPTRRDIVRFVSSYAEQIHRDVWPKSPATLQWVADQVIPSAPRRLVGRTGYLDVLVTGAGFELRPQPWGGDAARALRHLGFGLPWTREILESMADPFSAVRERPGLDALKDDEKVFLCGRSGGFPVPWDRFLAEPELSAAAEKLANHNLLDEWWDLVLEAELRSRLRAESSRPERRRAKGAAWTFEVKMREAFRRAILRHDWGHLAQALAAARTPWVTWLTTNYTRFADRAIALTAQAKDREEREFAEVIGAVGPTRNGAESQRFSRAPSWRIVGTAQEAQLLIRQLQDRRDRDLLPWNETPLFKLHGDISHLQTMAIAGHDKELFSGLSVPVDSLYQVYDAAEKYLLRVVRDQPRTRLLFHVVGHGLKDEALVSVLTRVAMARSRSKTVLRLVAPKPPELPPVLSGLVTEDPVPMRAEKYMATLKPSHL